ncbi:MAG TPA: DUF2892 domain-containing protein [Marmoricola sp.]
MNIDRAVLVLAGTLTLVSVLLAALLSPWWMLLATFVGLNQLQASLTGWCPAALVLRRLGVPSGCAFAEAPRENQG